MPPSGINHVGLDSQIVTNEFGGIDVIRVDAANFGGGQNDMVGPFLSKESIGSRLIREVEFAVRADREICVTVTTQSTCDGRSHEPTMPSNVDFILDVHF